jgi:hypothetical protein
MNKLHRYVLALCLLLSSLSCFLPPRKEVWSDESGRPVKESVIDIPRLVCRMGYLWTFAYAMYILIPNPIRLLDEEESEEPTIGKPPV